jgi:hypothetical protein
MAFYRWAWVATVATAGACAVATGSIFGVLFAAVFLAVTNAPTTVRNGSWAYPALNGILSALALAQLVLQALRTGNSSALSLGSYELLGVNDARTPHGAAGLVFSALGAVVPLAASLFEVPPPARVLRRNWTFIFESTSLVMNVLMLGAAILQPATVSVPLLVTSACLLVLWATRPLSDGAAPPLLLLQRPAALLVLRVYTAACLLLLFILKTQPLRDAADVRLVSVQVRQHKKKAMPTFYSVLPSPPRSLDSPSPPASAAQCHTTVLLSAF